MSTDKHWKVAIATVLTRLHWTEKAIRNMLGEIVEMLAAAEPAGDPPDVQRLIDAAEALGLDDCFTGGCGHDHSEDCVTHLYERAREINGALTALAKARTPSKLAPLHASRTTRDADEGSP